ncbi:MAG TPA: lysozyme family protein [Caproicibacter sp.]|nr:lysozyme family protein [Caproicibacter sp.]
MTPIFFVFIIGAFLAAVVGGSAAGSQSNIDGGGDGTLSAEVLAYQPIVSQYCSKYGIPDYVLLVLSVMQQESGGSRKDLMQCSECPLNTKYPNKPNSITDPKYSIEIGTEYLASCLRAALCKSPSDIPGISLALQGYNFGGGYISWAFEHGGGYSQANAIQFSELKARDLNCKSYGDSQYVNRVLKYYNFNSTGSGTFGYPLKPGTYSITRGYGYDDGVLHKGIDFAAPVGTNIYAASSGTVVFAGYGASGNGYNRYGNVIVIKQNEKYSTLYGHCSKLLVTTGQAVQRGSVIGLVGSTGDSTGNHCHFEIRVNGSQVDPAPYLSQKKAV